MDTQKSIARTVEATVELEHYIKNKDSIEDSLKEHWVELFGENDAQWKFRLMNPRREWVRIICERYAGR